MIRCGPRWRAGDRGVFVSSRDPAWLARPAVGLAAYLAAWGVVALLTAATAGCGERWSDVPPESALLPRTVAEAVQQTSASCRECHAEVYAAWAATDHARANRSLEREEDSEAFDPSRVVEDGGSRFHLGWTDELPFMLEMREDGSLREHPAEMVLGNKPLRQFLVSAQGGRWQPVDLAYDPGGKEWFNVFGQEERRPGEWGHWTGRGMNWNSMCAPCHMTGYEKGYDPASDNYRSRWVEQGVGCIQCHGPMEEDHARDPASLFRDRQRAMETCAPCHAHNEPLTERFQPGDHYHDHYRVTLPVEPGLFYPDGQQRHEVFNWTSMVLSRMGHAGVTCMDCHDAHTSETVLPVEDNSLCMQCHGTPGRMNASIVDPIEHSRHDAGSPGHRCVSCHMPTTTYMQRARRHDHGWHSPDPLLTRELGIPNACSACHTDRSIDWVIAAAERWYGDELESSRQRARARAVAAARALEPGAAADLVDLHATEDIPGWRATYLLLLAPYAYQEATVPGIARESLRAADPMERSAAVRVLTGHPRSSELLRPMLEDPVRLVRIDAAWGLSAELEANSPFRQEFDAYLALSMDQPAGRLRRGQDLANRGLWTEAEAEMKLAIEWDPYSAATHEMLGYLLHAGGRLEEAADAFLRAARLDPRASQSLLRSGLLYAEADRLDEAEAALRKAVERDPGFHRAWYNLGMMLAQAARLDEAAEALRRAEAIDPDQGDYPYALATVLIRFGDSAGAIEAARRVLALEPSHPGARRLVEMSEARP
jgi:predicted CXXCH cytochrome family protein